MNATTLEIPSYFIVSQEQFELLAIANRDLRLERSPNGELISKNYYFDRYPNKENKINKGLG
jgi:hypothetical protein